jgi:photosystem II stability/assembly factor-like uncharacterized protein
MPLGYANYLWTVPNTLSANCKVRISDANDVNIFSISHNVFTISPPMTWIETQPAGNTDIYWQATSMSSDGTKIIAGSSSKLYISTNSGDSWNETQPAGNKDLNWCTTSMSFDGTIIIAGGGVEYNNGFTFETMGWLYISTNGGNTWKEIRPAPNNSDLWQKISISHDGTKIIAGGGIEYTAGDVSLTTGSLIISTDSGNNWIENQPVSKLQGYWHTTSMSSDGSKIIAGGAGYGGRLFISTNGGNIWNETQPAENYDAMWYTTSMSSDGIKIIAGVNGGRLYISTDGGTSWNETQPAGNTNESWNTTSMSLDGTSIIAGVYGGRLYISTDGGSSWNETQPFGNNNVQWRTSAMNSDGSKMIAASSPGRLYLYNKDVTSAKGPQQLLPKEYNLSQNYPNPFNPTTTIDYQLPKAGNVTLRVYDILGREVTTLVNGFVQAGYYKTQFNASNLASGIYIYELRVNDYRSVKKLMLLK